MYIVVCTKLVGFVLGTITVSVWLRVNVVTYAAVACQCVGSRVCCLVVYECTVSAPCVGTLTDSVSSQHNVVTLSYG